MNIGVKMRGRLDNPGEFLADAQALETAGAHSLWLSDGMFRPSEADRSFPPMLDPWPLLAAIAAVTSRVRLGTSVAVLAQWPPAVFAQTITTLERLSRGRMIVGAGAGWEPVQLESNGVPMAGRGRRLDEYIQVVRRIWSGELSAFDGEFYRLPAMRVAEPLREGGPPILIGAFSEPGFRRAAHLGDGFIHGGGPAEQVKQVFDRVRGLRDEAGREGDFELWVQVRAPEGRAAWKETLEAYRETGATGVIVNHAPNLLDILRNPDEEDNREDLRMAVG